MATAVNVTYVLQVLAMCFVRKGLDRIFSRHELKWLDDIMPESHKREKEEKKKRMLANAVGLFAEVHESLIIPGGPQNTPKLFILLYLLQNLVNCHKIWYLLSRINLPRNCVKFFHFT